MANLHLKGGVAMGPTLQRGSWEIKSATKYAQQSQGVQGVRPRFEAGATLGLKVA